MPNLLPHHLTELLTGSGITQGVIDQRGYYSITEIADLHTLGFTNLSADNLPVLVIPLHTVDGVIGSYQVKPDHPRIRDGKPLKYESLPGKPPVIDIPPAIHFTIGDPTRDVYITEGSKKADSAIVRNVDCYSVQGVYGFRGRNEFGGIADLPDWDRIAINDRTFYLAFDSDVMTKPQVLQALRRLANMLKRRGAKGVIPIVIPQEGEAKIGLDDWFVAGKTASELRAHIDYNILKPRGIIVNGRSLPDITADGLKALTDQNIPPQIFVRDGRLTKIRYNENNHASIEDFGQHTMRAALARAADWIKVTVKKDDREVTDVFPPKDVVDDVLAVGEYPGIPPIIAVIESPKMDRNGDISTAPGYNPNLAMYLASSEIWGEWNGSTADAFALIDDIIGDFPFVSDADRAHALALMLLPVVRPLIDGPTPLHLIDAPTQATGKSLLARLCLIPAVGKNIHPTDAPKRPEEWEKKLTGALRPVPDYIFFDNLTNKVEASALDIAIASTFWSGRVLGESRNINVPIQCSWVATSNNAQLSTDITRRTIQCRLDAKVERPGDRKGWKIANVEEYTAENRPRIVAALCHIAKEWANAGFPQFTGLPLASFESWSSVIGGILQYHRVPGFLANLKALRESADSGNIAWGEFYKRWWSNKGGVAVKASDLIYEFEQDEELTGLLGDKGESSRKTRLGHLLKRRVDVILNGFRLEMAGHYSGSQHYRLVMMPTESESETLATDVEGVADSIDGSETKPHGKTANPTVNFANPPVENSNALGSNEDLTGGFSGVSGGFSLHHVYAHAHDHACGKKSETQQTPQNPLNPTVEPDKTPRFDHLGIVEGYLPSDSDTEVI